MFETKPPLVLVSDPTQDFMEALLRAAFTADADPEMEAFNAKRALEGGAMVDPGEAFRHTPLHVLLYGWDQSSVYRRAFTPIFNELVNLSNQEVLNSSLDLTFEISDPRQANALAKRLLERGARPSNKALSVIGWRLELKTTPKKDEHAAQLLNELDRYGWRSSDDAACRKFLGQVIKTLSLKTLDTFVLLCERHDINLPLTTGEDGYSPICDIHMHQSKLKDKQVKQHEMYNSMIERLAHSGLLTCEEGPLRDWKARSAPWVLEAAVEGEARRLARRTQPAPLTQKPSRRM